MLQSLKAHPIFQRIPVVILTSSREDSGLKSAYDLGVSSSIEVAERIELHWRALIARPY